jgi:arylsulfatase A-like enzyme
MKAYYRMLTEMDQVIGRIVEELKEQGVYENTLIIFTGDNGYFHAEHGLADKWYPYEEALRVPLVVYDPRLKPEERNKVIDEFVLNIDIAPSILSAAGSEIPGSMQGRDFSGLYLSRQNKNWRKDFYYEHPFVTSEKRIPSSEALVTHTDKYIFWPHYQYEEYFDRENDPYEKNNLINMPEYEQKIGEMKNRFTELKALAQ